MERCLHICYHDLLQKGKVSLVSEVLPGAVLIWKHFHKLHQARCFMHLDSLVYAKSDIIIMEADLNVDWVGSHLDLVW